MQPRHSTRHAQSGNALFLVLIGIALLAALSYSVMKAGRSSGTMSQENVAFAGNAIMLYGDKTHNAVQTIMTGGNDISTVSFENAALANYTNANAVAASKVFGSTGGGLAYAAPDTAWLDSAQSARDFYGQWYFPKNRCVPFVGAGGDGVTNGSADLCSADATDNEELTIVLPYVKADICTYIDQKLGITLCSGSACTASDTLLPAAASDEFAGTFSNGKAFYSASGSSAFNHQNEGCIRGTGTSAGMYFYYKVLAER